MICTYRIWNKGFLLENTGPGLQLLDLMVGGLLACDLWWLWEMRYIMVMKCKEWTTKGWTGLPPSTFNGKYYIPWDEGNSLFTWNDCNIVTASGFSAICTKIGNILILVQTFQGMIQCYNVAILEPISRKSHKLWSLTTEIDFYVSVFAT